MKKFILSIDQGTTNSRIVLFNTKFQVIDTMQKELKQYFPKNGWVEHDANEIWKSVKKLIKLIIKKNAIISSQILSIGITNQRETTVLWNKKTGKPVYNAIVWQDRRTINYCNLLIKKGFQKKIRKITGLIIDPYFSATKIRWILNKVKNRKKLIKNNNLLFGTIDTWLLWNLTNGKSHFTDITNASRTMLYDIKKEKWSREILSILKIPINIMPTVKPNVYKFGTTRLFGKDIDIGGMAGDQQAATIGQACFKNGQSKCTYGTGCFLLINIGEKFKLSQNNLLTSVAFKINNKKMYCFEGSIFVAGSALQWLKDNLNFFTMSSETAKIAKKRDKNHNITFIPALTGLGAPYWNSNVRGVIFGITRNTSIPDIVSATLESIGFLTNDLIDCIEKDIGKKINLMKIDGGMAKNIFFIQILSNIINMNIIKPNNIETTALGAAYLAGLYSDILKNTTSINKLTKYDKIFKPNISKLKRNYLINNWKKHIKKLLN